MTHPTESKLAEVTQDEYDRAHEAWQDHYSGDNFEATLRACLAAAFAERNATVVAVPLEPTDAMLAAAHDCTPTRKDCPDYKVTARSIYACMLAARPNAVAYDSSLKQGAVVEAVRPFGYITTFAVKALAELESAPFSVQCVVSGTAHEHFQVPIYTTPPTPHATTDTTDAAQGAWHFGPSANLDHVRIYPDGYIFDEAGTIAQFPVLPDGGTQEICKRICDAHNATLVIPAEQQAASEGRRVVTDADVDRGFTTLTCGMEFAAYKKEVTPYSLRGDVRATLAEFASTLPAGDEGMARRLADKLREVCKFSTWVRNECGVNELLAEYDAAQTARGGK